MELDKKIKNAIEELNDLEKAFKESKEIYEQKKRKLSYTIQNFMGINKIDSIDFINKSKNICKVIFVQPKKIVFDADKLEKRLGKKICSKFIKKQYAVKDIDKFLNYMKSINADPKIIKNLLLVSKEVDSKKIDQLSEIGEITEKDIKGCYTIKEISHYLKLSEVENEEGEVE